MRTSAAILNFAGRPNSVLVKSGLRRVGNPRIDAAGKRVKLAIAQNERGARKLRGEESIAEPQLVAQRHRSRLLDEQRVGPSVDHELAHALGDDDAARPLAALEDDYRPFPLAQFVRGRESRHAAPTMATSKSSVISRQSAVVSRQSSVSVSSRQSAALSTGCRLRLPTT